MRHILAMGIFGCTWLVASAGRAQVTGGIEYICTGTGADNGCIEGVNNVNNTGAKAIAGFNNESSGGPGIYGYSLSTSAIGPGVFGQSFFGSSNGVVGTYNVNTPTPGQNGVLGVTSAGSPGAGVYGTSTATNQALGVFGNVTGTNSVGVEGESDVGIGMFGMSTNTTNGWGVVGVNQSGGFNGSAGGAAVEGAAEGSGGIGLYGRCIGSCTAANGGLAARFDGNVAPGTDSAYNLGSGSRRWSTVFAMNGMINTSDRRMKKDVRDLPYGLRAVRELHPVTFKWKSGADVTEHLGLIAQDVEKVIPNVVAHGEKADDTLGLNYAELVPVLINAVQEQQKIIDRQEARLDTLERGRGSVLSNLVPSGLGGLALGLVPLGLIASRRKRQEGSPR
jgi:hypothetical protein